MKNHEWYTDPTASKAIRDNTETHQLGKRNNKTNKQRSENKKEEKKIVYYAKPVYVSK